MPERPPEQAAIGQGVAVVLENPCNLHNVERILRVCGAFGVAEVCYVLDRGRPGDPRTAKQPDLSRCSGHGCRCRTFESTAECLRSLAGEGYASVATALELPSADLYASEAPAAPRVAFWFGHERHGLTADAIGGAASRLFIPTAGMVQSLNVATSAAVVLAEAVRRRGFAASREPLQPVPATPAGRPLPPHGNSAVAEGPQPCECPPPAPAPGGGPAPCPITKERLEKFETVAKQRQRGLTVVLENPDRLDAGAMLRSCDAFGVSEVHFVFEGVRPFDPLANRQVIKSEGSNLWVCSRVFGSVAECACHLNDRGYASAAVVAGGAGGAAGASSIFAPGLAEHDQLALWFGGDGGLTEGALTAAPLKLFVPAKAGAQGLVASNTVAVVLAETVRQRRAACSPARWQLTRAEQESVVSWCVAVYLKRHPGQLEAGEPLGDGAGMSPEYQRLGQLRAKLARQGW